MSTKTVSDQATRTVPLSSPAEVGKATGIVSGSVRINTNVHGKSVRTIAVDGQLGKVQLRYSPPAPLNKNDGGATSIG